MADPLIPTLTLCGCSWQGWQAPDAIVRVAPYTAPQKRDTIKQCQWCLVNATSTERKT